MTLRGITWRAGVALRPRTAGDDPAATTLIATVELTPVAAEGVSGYATPSFDARDRDGHTWEALPAGFLSTSDLRPGETSRITVVAAVPDARKDAAELVLRYSPGEVLRFAR